MNKITLRVGVVLATLLGIVAVADALVVTDEEKLEAFAYSISGDVEVDRIDDALRYVSTLHEGLQVDALGERDFYDEGEDAEIGARAREALTPYLGHELELVQHSVTLEGDEGHVAVRVRTPDRRLIDARFTLYKHGERWIVAEATLR